MLDLVGRRGHWLMLYADVRQSVAEDFPVGSRVKISGNETCSGHQERGTVKALYPHHIDVRLDQGHMESFTYHAALVSFTKAA